MSAPATDEERLLKPAEVMELLSVSRSYLAKLRMKGGGPPFVKVGIKKTAVRYPLTGLEAWVQALPRR
jgi:predicted DNA-binding transcriptional regulator AlpA